MTDKGTLQDIERPLALPPEVRANMLASQESIFFNVALFEHCQRVADLFAKSTMVGKDFEGNIGNCMIALNYAGRIQADPFMTMQLMHVIHGKPGVEGKLVKALIERSGKYRDVDYEWLDANNQPIDDHKVYENNAKDGRGCRLFGTNNKTDKLVKGPKVSWKVVYEEGWFNKNGSKWKTIPELMFMYRSASWFANVHCPEVKLGMMTTEEIRDVVDMSRTPNGSWNVEAQTELEQKIAGASTTTDTPQDAGEAQEPTNEAETYVCLTCGFKAASERGLKKHITQSHSEEPLKDEAPLVDPETPEEDEPKGHDNPNWNKLLACPRMDGQRIPASKCDECKEKDGCPEWDAPF